MVLRDFSSRLYENRRVLKYENGKKSIISPTSDENYVVMANNDAPYDIQYSYS